MTGLRLLLTADAIGGVWQYATDLAHALKPLDVEAILVLLGPSPSADQRAMAKDLHLIDTGLPVDWLCRGPEPVRAAASAVADIARREAVDLVQLNMPTLAGAHFPVPTIAVAHGCVSTWWQAARREPVDAGYLWHREMMRDGLRKADRIVAPTAAYARMISEHYDLPTAPMPVHNGRRVLYLPETAVRDFAFTAGRLWDPAKNAAVLDRAASRLSFPFVAAGALRGPNGETTQLEHLVVLDHVDEANVAVHLAARPVFVSAATFEPFGLAVLEAAAAGCALVLSDIPTFRELWDEAATFVSADDADGFARAIEAIVGDPARRRQLGRSARARAQRYTAAATAAAMAHLYASLLAPVRGTAAA